jgi:hypothetical protein
MIKRRQWIDNKGRGDLRNGTLGLKIYTGLKKHTWKGVTFLFFTSLPPFGN